MTHPLDFLCECVEHAIGLRAKQLLCETPYRLVHWQVTSQYERMVRHRRNAALCNPFSLLDS